mgnify:CR=1 FL=1
MKDLINNYEIYSHIHENELFVFNKERITDAVSTADLYEFSLMFGKHFPIEHPELLSKDEYENRIFYHYNNHEGYQKAGWDDLNKEKVYVIWDGDKFRKFHLESQKFKTNYKKEDLNIVEVLDSYKQERDRALSNKNYLVKIDNNGKIESAVVRGTAKHFQDTIPKLMILDQEEKEMISVHGFDAFCEKVFG